MSRLPPAWLLAILMCVSIDLLIRGENGVSPDAIESAALASDTDVPVWIGSTPRAARGTRWVRTSFPSPALYLIGAGERVPLPSSYPALTLLGLGSPSFGEPSFNKLSKPVAV